MIGFMDKFPVEDGHCLIIPRKHYVNILDIEKQVYLDIHNLARYVARAVMDVFHADGINIGQNNGECAKQIVMHYHLHVIPRHCGQELMWSRLDRTDQDLERYAQMIASRLNDIINLDII